jgi:hypothetical protein
MIFRGQFDCLSAILAKYGYFLFWTVLAIHAAECVWIHKTRLLKHGVVTGSALWWKWIAMTFLEGVGSVKRLDAEVRRLEREGEGKKAH